MHDEPLTNFLTRWHAKVVEIKGMDNKSIITMFMRGINACEEEERQD